MPPVQRERAVDSLGVHAPAQERLSTLLGQVIDRETAEQRAERRHPHVVRHRGLVVRHHDDNEEVVDLRERDE
jgi:hypothetical protein